MITKILLKIIYAFAPSLLYIFWVIISTMLIARIRKMAKNSGKSAKKDYVEGEFKVVNEEKTSNRDKIRDKISLSNKNFVISIYLSLFLLILVLIFGVFLQEQNLTQSTIEDLKSNIRVE